MALEHEAVRADSAVRPRSPAPLSPSAPQAPLSLWAWLAVLLLALLPSWGTLGAPWISEDAAILGYVHREGPFSDWFSTQYGLRTVRFWRPLVTTVWGLQEALGGVDPLFLRSYNLGCHAAAALLLVAVARRLGLGPVGALMAGALAALFPEQGGTVTWISGRTDGSSAPWMLLACLLALVSGARGAGRRGFALAAAGAALLACAAKEMAFVLPFWVALLSWARSDDSRILLRCTVPVAFGVGIAFVWRSLAVGGVVGGYPTDTAGALLEAAPRAAWTWLSASLPIAGAALVVAAAGAWARSLHARLWLAGLVCAALGGAPLISLLTDGVLEPQNARTLRVGDLGFALAVAAGFGSLSFRAAARARAAPALVACLALLVWRGAGSWQDTHEWARAGELGEEQVAAARRALGTAAPSRVPVLRAGFARHHEGAYALSFGVADRFREPFPPTVRPIWPLRPLFGLAQSERTPLIGERGGLYWPEDPGPLEAPALELSTPRGEQLRLLSVDESAARDPDESPRFLVGGSFPDCGFELVLYTEMGYEPAFWRLAGPDALHELSLRQALLLGNGLVSLAETLIQAADLGGTQAYLEVRAVRADGSVAAASPWLELRWEQDLLDRLPR